MLSRRDALKTFAAASAAMAFSRFTRAADAPRKKILFFSKSDTFEHSVIKRPSPEKLSFAEQLFTDLAAKQNLDVVCSKDGRLFDDAKTLATFDAFLFYTLGDLSKPGLDKQPGVTATGKTALLDAIHNGTGFIGLHSASDTYHSPTWKKGELLRDVNAKKEDNFDPFIQMIGGEMVFHAKQQEALQHCVDEKFPGAKGFAESKFMEEWYSLKNFAPDLHVILMQETQGMVGDVYQRKPFPSTWARKHGAGRVFYSSMGHREDVWQKTEFQKLLFGAIAWATGVIDADIPPNLQSAAPDAETFTK